MPAEKVLTLPSDLRLCLLCPRNIFISITASTPRSRHYKPFCIILRYYRRSSPPRTYPPSHCRCYSSGLRHIFIIVTSQSYTIWLESPIGVTESWEMCRAARIGICMLMPTDIGLPKSNAANHMIHNLSYCTLKWRVTSNDHRIKCAARVVYKELKRCNITFN